MLFFGRNGVASATITALALTAILAGAAVEARAGPYERIEKAAENIVVNDIGKGYDITLKRIVRMQYETESGRFTQEKYRVILKKGDALLETKIIVEQDPGGEISVYILKDFAE